MLTYRKYTRELYENLQKAQEKRAQEKQANLDIQTPEQIIQEIHKILIPHVSTSLVSPTIVPHTFNVTLPISPTKSLNVTTQLNALTPIATLISQL